jgi:uncharacterized membrane protein
MSKLGHSLIRRFTAPPSAAGLVVGALFWLAALTPSLIPREGLLQGAIAGLAFAVGYGLAAGLVMLWAWLGLPVARTGQLRGGRWLPAALAAVLVLAGAFLARGWQNEIYQALGLPPVETVRPFTLLATGLGVALVLIAAGRFFGALKDLFDAPLRRVLPPRASLLVAFLLAAWSFWAIGNGFLLDAILRGLDSAYRTVDSLIPPEEERPSAALMSGSPASLLTGKAWGGRGAAMFWKPPPPPTSRRSPAARPASRSGSMSGPTPLKRWRNAPPWRLPKCSAPAPSTARSW